MGLDKGAYLGLNPPHQALNVSAPENHAHSPRRQRIASIPSNYTGHSFGAPPIQSSSYLDMTDPFIDHHSFRNPAPFNENVICRSNNPQGKIELRLPEDQLARLIEAVSPSTRTRFGIPNDLTAKNGFASGNIASQSPIPAPMLGGVQVDPKVNAAVSVHSTPTSQTRPLEDRQTLWDTIHAIRSSSERKHERDPTDISMHMACTDYPNCNHEGDNTGTRYSTDSPAKRVKGRKEGTKDETPSSTRAPRTRRQTASAEKRKRSSPREAPGPTGGVAVEAVQTGVSALLQAAECETQNSG
jgi:hypothetical protein